jgi:hypothetical protein
MSTELEIARGVADGSLPSPTEYLNSFYWSIRISGVGVIWRGAPINEFAYRAPDIWLSDAMIARVPGLPVTAEHPPVGTLNSHEFAQRAVGACLFGFIRDNELWAIARILDRHANELMQEGLDTSPGCQFSPGAGARLTVDGKPFLVEGNPCLLDHIAIVEKGRWTRDGAAGVENTEEDARAA